MSRKISIRDFYIEQINESQWQVDFTSALTYSKWSNSTRDSELIQRVLDGKCLIMDLNKLKKIAKAGIQVYKKHKK